MLDIQAILWRNKKGKPNSIELLIVCGTTLCLVCHSLIWISCMLHGIPLSHSDLLSLSPSKECGHLVESIWCSPVPVAARWQLGQGCYRVAGADPETGTLKCLVPEKLPSQPLLSLRWLAGHPVPVAEGNSWDFTKIRFFPVGVCLLPAFVPLRTHLPWLLRWEKRIGC